MISHSDPPFRVVTIGEASVGKTSITNRLIEEKFNLYEPSTIGANYQPFITAVDGKKVEIQIWDTAGQEKFKSLTPIYYRNAAAGVAVFSLTKQSSFEQLNDLIKSFYETAGHNALLYIAANKSDMIEEISVDFEEAKRWAELNRYKIYKTSAQNGEGIKELFSDLANELYFQKLNKETTQRPNIHKKNNQPGCC